MLTTFYSFLGAVVVGVAILLVTDIATTSISAIAGLFIHFFIGIGSGLTFVKLYNYFELREHRPA